MNRDESCGRNMSVSMFQVAPTMKESWIILLFISHAWSGDWRVTFKDQCALEGASVLIGCEYDYPLGHLVTSVAWYRGQQMSDRWILYSLPTSSTQVHFQYVGNSRGNCSLRINNLKRADEGHYFFSFKTLLNSWTSRRPLHLSVKELTAVLEPSTVTEGQEVSLSCWSGCATRLQVVWYRDGTPVPRPVFSASIKDSGGYYCAVLGQKIQSASVALNVQYAPNDVLLSMKPAEDVINASSVTLGCSSHANPPVPQSGYSLYKDDQLISSGRDHIISPLQPHHSGLYHCQASNNISRRGVTYVRSSGMNLDVQYLPSVAEGSSVNVTCSSTANPANHSHIWYKWTNSSSLLQMGIGQVLSLPSMETSHTGMYLCQARNRLGVVSSTKVLLAMEDDTSGGRSLQVRVLAGLGVCLFGTLVIALLLLWNKQRSKAEKKVPAQHVSPAAAEDNIYANVSLSTPHPHPPPHIYSKQQHAIDEHDEVTYSTVTIKAKHPQESRFKMEQQDETVIYSNVANSS
ncbi:B-cell receptor CD22-like isoform X3 [Entelurus aequoreus]|uniref:B-cell receptor CD22-like isoform X3 n=1 Tax=Entelurus aequoreus TaxID=161455 RepID=UPI002B1E05B1|nr:B-cell receptor CD22-like isoform X3 [Entelurus aequoreus]